MGGGPVKKEIIFAAKINTAEFNSQLKDMQKRIVDAMGGFSTFEQASLGGRMQRLGISTPGQPTQNQQDTAMKRSAREIEGIIKDQWKQVRELNKEMDVRLSKLAAVRKEEEAIVKAGKDATEVARKRADIEMDLSRKQAEHRVRMQALSESVSAREKLEEHRPRGMNRIIAAYQGAYANSVGGLPGMARGMGAAGTAAYRMGGGAFGLAGMGIGALSAGLMLADPVVRQVAGQDRVMAGAQGSAVQGLSGPLQDLYSGNARQTMLFSRERQTAMTRAIQETETNRRMDAAGPWATIGGQASAGAAGGAAIGTGLTLWSGPGALFGAGAGAIGGGVIGGAKGMYDVASNSRSRDVLLSQLGSSSARQRLESGYAADLSQRMNENFAAEKARDPLKVLADQSYSENMGSNLQFQRQLGLTNRGFYGEGGFLDQGTNAGFSREDMMGSASGIIGAGGSTRAARGSADFAARLARGDITNASSIVGRLSANMGSAAMTEQATIKVLAEGVKAGLDKSEFREEQRKFADLTAMAVVASGANSAAGAARAAQEFGSFFGQTPTMGAMAQASTAQGLIDSATSQTGNARGAIFAAKAQTNSMINKLDAPSKATLSQMPLSAITEDNPMIMDMAAQAGVDVKTFVTEAKKVKLDSVTVTRGSEQAKQELMNMSDAEFEDPNNRAKVGRLMNRLGAEDSSIMAMAAKPEAQMAYARRLRKGEVTPEGGAADARAGSIGDTGAQGTGRMEDVDFAAVANQQKIVNEQFREMAPNLERAATAALNMNKAMMQVILEMNDVINSGGKITPEMTKRWSTLGGQAPAGAASKPGAQKAK
jgi:hypothetical protein